MAALQNVADADTDTPIVVSEPGAKLRVACEQAIFTSVRTPSGEGYRIIAASRGLTADEKRAITTNAPSHNGLCDSSADGEAVAFYPLPSGRLCAAYSCCAGAEHTGRGGQRVYTFIVVFAADRFPLVRYNPFNVFRAIEAAHLGELRLNPPAQLDALELDVVVRRLPSDSKAGTEAIAALGSKAHRKRTLTRLLSEKPVVLILPEYAPPCAEALILAVPGPMRGSLSFSVGVRFSVSRCYRLSLSTGDAMSARNMAAGRAVEVIDPAKPITGADEDSEWFNFVEGMWQRGDFEALDRRTSAPIEDDQPEALEQTAEVFGALDDVDGYDLYQLLEVAGECLRQEGCLTPGSPYAELLDRIQARLIRTWDEVQGLDVQAFWSRAVRLWRESDAAVMFVQPVLDRGVEIMMSADPWLAAGRVLEIARDFPLSAYRAGLGQTIVKVLDTWADAWTQDRKRSPKDKTGVMLLNHWRTVRPKCAILDRLTQYVTSHADANAATKSAS